MEIFLDRTFAGITAGSLYVMVALALVVVFRASGTINFAQGEFALFTSYIAWWLTTHGVPIFYALLVCIVIGFVIGAVAERTLIRPVSQKSEAGVLIVALGLFSALNGLDGWIWGPTDKVFPNLLPRDESDYIEVLGSRLHYDTIGVVIILALTVLALTLILNKTSLGLQMRAVSSNRESAALSGIRIGVVLCVSWGLSSAIGSLAGVLIVPTLPPNQLNLGGFIPIIIFRVRGSPPRRPGQHQGRRHRRTQPRDRHGLAQRLCDIPGRHAPADRRSRRHRRRADHPPDGSVRNEVGGEGMTNVTTEHSRRTTRWPIVIIRNSPRHVALIALGLGTAFLAISWGSGLAPFEQGQVTRVLIYAIAIAGLNVATGYAGLISIGHSAFFGLGAYTTGILVVSHGWQATYTLPVAFAVCFVAGLVVGLPALRIRGLYFATVTIAFGVAFPEIINHFPDLTGGTSGLRIRRSMLRPPEWTGLTLAQKDLYLYWLSAIVLVLVMLLVRNLVRSRYGKALIATRDNEIAAASSGVNLAVSKTVAFAVSGAITGVGGSLFAMYLGILVAVDSFTLLSAIALLTGLMIGGQSTLMAPVVGALVVVYLPYYTADFGQGQASGVLFGAALIAIIFVMPQGIVGTAQQVLHRLVEVRLSIPPSRARRHTPGADPASETPDLRAAATTVEEEEAATHRAAAVTATTTTDTKK